jgi:hypothetical protein
LSANFIPLNLRREKPATFPFEGIELADNIFNRAFKEIRHARQAIEIL